MTTPARWSASVPPAGTPAWYVRGTALPHGRWQVRCYVDARHPDGEVVADPGPLDDLFLLWDADLDHLGRPLLTLSPAVTKGAPGLWFVQLDDRAATPPATALVAFATAHLPAGTVVTDPVFFHLPLRSDEQVGAIRWWHDTAVVDQVYVRDDLRRIRVGTAIIYAASAFHQLQGWPGRLHSDGRRTVLGQALVTGLHHPERIAPLQTLLSPMDLVSNPDGVRPNQDGPDVDGGGGRESNPPDGGRPSQPR